MYEGPEFRHLRFFIAVAEELNIGKAAAKLNVTQPNVTRAIQQLEDGMKTVLFRRGPAGAALTDRGLAFLPFARKMVDMRSESIRATSTLPSTRHHPLRFGYSPFINHRLVTDAMQGFCELVPDSSIEPSSECSGHLIPMILGGSLEAALVTLQGVNVYRETSREFASGDRLQFTLPNKDLGVANRDLGTVIGIRDDQLTVKLDGKSDRAVSFNPNDFRHFDHGYAVTSHSSQGLTAGRVLANFDTDSARNLINTRLAYVAISRASDEVQVYTNDTATLGVRLANDISKTSAVDFREQSPAAVGALKVPGNALEYAAPIANRPGLAKGQPAIPHIEMESPGIGL